MDAAAADSSPLHVVIFPWLAFGHMLPCLELAERLAARGHHVSFVSTPRNISRLRPVAPALAQFIDLTLVALPFPRVEGLPEGAEATSDVPPEKLELHREALDGLAAPFSAFLDAACADEGGKEGNNKVDWVIVDSFHRWIAEVAHEHKVPCVLNMPYSATTSVLYGMPDPTVVDHPLGASVVRRFLQTFDKCKILAYRSCLEFEPESMPLLPNIFNKPVIPLGLLPPPAGGHKQERESPALTWLDEQPPKSVVYVAFGSELPLIVEQLHEIALDLELAGQRFLWALRKPNGVDPDADVLPPGFEARTRGRGLVATGWVPQSSILARAAVGAFMTHCGWSSTIEGLRCGHPMVMLPVYGDQWPNARMMEARKVGVKVPKHVKDGSFDRDGIAGAVRAVMCEEEGKRVFAENANKMQDIVAGKCHERHIDEFVQCLRTYKE
ncbi:hypothetical protein PR202_ga13154 [Eleusine coracana subsp. coracana]|uniref:Glycosyltransferase n=1 Tax=Eleusine coracana subsp. coracana TaxID=191504 RepID=A0AAV5CDT8_ELECO|nr:hypothetical protein PR202_ga13154 [Eleusine coracana subsp. coracana]